MKSRKIAPSEPAEQELNTIPAADRNFSISETAAWSGLSDPTVWREIAAGKLQAVRIRGRTLVTPEARMQWKSTWCAVRGAA